MIARIGGAVVAAALISGCMSTGSYSGARTLERAAVSHTIAANLIARQDDADELTVIPVPTLMYVARAGLGHDLDVGARVSLSAMLAIDVKWNPIRTQYFDLAFAPGMFGGLFPTRSSGTGEGTVVCGVELPVIAGLNLFESLSLVAYGGPGYAYFPDHKAGGAVIRTGGGLQLRLEDVIIQPELSTVIDTIRGEPIDTAFGLGISLGAQPRFD